MNKREARKRVASLAAAILWRGGDHPEALFEDDQGAQLPPHDVERMEAAWSALVAKLQRVSESP